jgi:hypothetical protein
MSEDESTSLPISAGSDMVPLGQGDPDSSRELVIAVTAGGMLIDGDLKAVESYLEKIKAVAGQAVDVAGITKGAAGNLAGLAVGAVSAFAQNGQFVQLSERSMQAIRNGNLIQGDAGFFRMTTISDGGKFLEQLQWRPVSLGPTQMVSIQMIAVQMTLKMAIAEVDESVRRVEGKVESVLKLVEANRVGDVRGHYAAVDRMVRNLDSTGILTATDWDSIAPLRTDLEVVIERLRAHVAETLESFDASKPVQERAEVLKKAVEDKSLGETLNLLVLAEESMNKWQRLRIARVQDVEPEHSQQVIDDAFDLLSTQVAEDGKLYSRAMEVLETYSRTDRIDGFRFWSVRDVAKHSKKLRDDLDAFARARRHQLAEWEELSTPTVGDAASRVIEVADDYSDRALEAAKETIANVGNFFSGDGEAKRKAVIRRAKGERRRVLRKARATIEDLKSQIGTTHVEPPAAMERMQDNVDGVLKAEAVGEAPKSGAFREGHKEQAVGEENKDGLDRP